MRQKTYNVQFRRKREGKTNYKKRLKLLLAGKPRLVVRPSLNNMLVQIVQYHHEGDKVIVSAHSSELEKLGWKFSKGNIPAAYLTGLLVGKKAGKKAIKEMILDIGLKSPVKGSRIFACLKGIIDAGIKVPASEEILPKEERLKGGHISKYAELIKKNNEEYKKKFSKHIKLNIDPGQISRFFEEAKNKILKVE